MLDLEFSNYFKPDRRLVLNPHLKYKDHRRSVMLLIKNTTKVFRTNLTYAYDVQ